MTRSLTIALAVVLLGMITAESKSAKAADVTIQTAALQTASDNSVPADTSLLSTKVSGSTPVTPVHWGRYYAYRPYYRPYYAYRPYYRPYVRPYYRPYVVPYYAPYGGAYYGGPVYW